MVVVVVAVAVVVVVVVAVVVMRTFETSVFPDLLRILSPT
jgi:hypothetical protein